MFDHDVPASNRAAAAMHARGREFARRFGIGRVHDVGPDQGISHVVVAENAYALPGTVLACSDSHTCSAGALNCAARGLGAPDLLYALTTGQDLVPGRRDRALRSRGQLRGGRIGEGSFPPHRRHLRRPREPECRVRRVGLARSVDRRAPHLDDNGRRAVRRIRHLRAGRGADRVRQSAQSGAVRAAIPGPGRLLRGAAADRSRRAAADAGAARQRHPQRRAGRRRRRASRSSRRLSAPAPTARSTISPRRRAC